MRRIRETLVFGLCLALLFCYAASAKAESQTIIGGGSAVVRLDFRITIPTILHLQVGSLAATVDRITFPVTDLPGTGAVAGTSSGTNPVPVRVAALVGAATNVTLTADSSTALDDGSGNNIPFTEILWTASGSFTGNTFNGTNNQQLDQFIGPGNRTGTYTFSYANANYYPNGTYDGTVTYTLTSP